jgi:hypothetical protein
VNLILKKFELNLDPKYSAAYGVNENITQFLGCASFSNSGSQHRIQQEVIDDKYVGLSRTSSESQQRVTCVRTEIRNVIIERFSGNV